MTDPRSDDPRPFELLWPLVGNDLPRHIDTTFFAHLDRLDAPSTRSEVIHVHAERLLLTYRGLLAVYYHRDRIESLETAVVQRVRASPDLLATGQTSSMRMPVLGHEFVAYLLAARRTLDYVARGVAACFNQYTVYKIKNLASALRGLPPADLNEKAVAQCVDVVDRFPHLLSEEGRHSDRDVAAHYWPIEPASLLIVNFTDGSIGLEFVDGAVTTCPPTTTWTPSA